MIGRMPTGPKESTNYWTRKWFERWTTF